MDTIMRAVTLPGRIDENSQLHLEGNLPVVGPSRVQVIILMPAEAEINEAEWLRAAAANPAFDFLKEPGEDIYTLSDGKPFNG
jgi:hypothetical protein